MRCRSFGAFLALLMAALLAAQDSKRANYSGALEKLPQDPGPQPVEFSHKKHVETAKLGCKDCHAAAANEDQAGFPSTATCMACHRTIAPENPEVRKLAAFHERKQRVPWVRVYRARDFVFFSHTNHLKAGAACGDCHGPVETRDVLLKEVSTNMAQCLACHKAKEASTDCALCHQLGQ